MDLNLTGDERRALAGELAEALVARGLALGDVERLAPLLVDRFRQAVSGDGPRRGGTLEVKGARADG